MEGSERSTISDAQFDFGGLHSARDNLHERITLEDMMGADKHSAGVWGGFSYSVPKPYLRERAPPNKEGDLKARFITAPGDGPAYKVGNEKRGRFFHLNWKPRRYSGLLVVTSRTFSSWLAVSAIPSAGCHNCLVVVCCHINKIVNVAGAIFKYRDKRTQVVL